MTLRRTFLAMAALLLTVFSSSSYARDNARGIEGTWVFYITIAGAPPCQCIQILTLAEDGSVQGPANDRFSGDARGDWALHGDDRLNITLAINTINPDGSAGGILLVKNTLRQISRDALTGDFTFDVITNGGTVVASGKGTQKAFRLKAE